MNKNGEERGKERTEANEGDKGERERRGKNISSTFLSDIDDEIHFDAFEGDTAKPSAL
jgi:hypothetical protein